MNSGRFGSASGIHCSINAVLPAFKTFQQITPKSPNPHTRPLRKVFEKTLRCFRTLYQSEALPANAGFRKRNERGTSPTKSNPIPASRILQQAARLAAPNRTAVPLPEIHGIFRSRTISILSLKFPCHPLLKSCICLRGAADRMKAENRSPISSTFRGGRGCGDGDSERFVGKT